MVGPADPVRELIEVHRELCEQAVDVLDIAAGLEDSGIGPAGAAAYRHTDVFGLAEELSARVARRPDGPGDPDGPGGPGPVARRSRRAAAALTAAAAHLVPVAVLAVGGASVPVAAAAVIVGAVVLTLATGRPRWSRWPGWAAAGYGLGAAVLLAAVTAGSVPLGAAAATAAGSARWCARWVRDLGRGHLGAAVTMAEFRARMRPVLPVAAVLQLALTGLWTAAALALTPGAPHGPDGSAAAAALSGAGVTAWAVQGCAGLALLVSAVLAHAGRAALAASVVLLAGAGTAALLLPSAQTAGRLVCAGPLALLLPYAWLLLGRPGAHRARPAG